MAERSGFRGRIWAVVGPANLMFAGISCGGATDAQQPQPTAAGTAGTAMSGGSGGSAAGTVMSGGSGGSTAGTSPTSTPGGSGASIADPPPFKLGDVTAEPVGNCTNNGVGTCCDYEPCFSLEQINQVNAMMTGGAMVEEGCPSALPQYGSCTFTQGGPVMKDGLCCYQFRSGGCCGRPFVVAGQDRRASLLSRDAQLLENECVASDAELAVSSRRALSQAWAEDALLEHASIASFNWFALELLQLSAPADLLQAAQQAALDETKHAELCFALASRFAGATLGPGPLRIDGLLPRQLAELAAAVLLEGCIGETLAAALAEAQLARCGDEQCRAALTVIAADEADHAVLGWRFLRYAVERGGSEVVQRVRQALSSAPRTIPARPIGAPASVWNHFGRLTFEQEQAVVEEAWRELIEPALLALCSEPASGQSLTDASSARLA